MHTHLMSCTKCFIKLRPRKNSVFVHITMSDGQPYQIWNADLWECPGCGNQVIAGHGNNPVSDHLRSNWEKMLQYVDYTIDGKTHSLKGD